MDGFYWASSLSIFRWRQLTLLCSNLKQILGMQKQATSKSPTPLHYFSMFQYSSSFRLHFMNDHKKPTFSICLRFNGHPRPHIFPCFLSHFPSFCQIVKLSYVIILLGNHTVNMWIRLRFSFRLALRFKSIFLISIIYLFFFLKRIKIITRFLKVNQFQLKNFIPNPYTKRRFNLLGFS